MSITVSTLVKYLKNKLDTDDKLQNIQVKGELSNFHRHNSGHLYFTLKDESAAISCVMFSSRASSLKFDPKNGDKVELTANASIFETSGQLQLYVNAMKLAGLGDLYQQYEELKNKLLKEGYFNDENKKELLINYPNKVAVLVGDKSAAMSDIKTCFLRRWPLAKVDYYPVLVQGKDAPQDIINILNKVDDLNYDYIILARGGGSFEDLFCFNDECLVKTIFNLKTFIITGIGHEQDYTLSDFVADMRAPTPTACVELTTPNIDDVKCSIDEYQELLSEIMFDTIDRYKLKLDYYSSNIYNYINRFTLISNNISAYKDSMMNSLKNKVTLMNNKLDSFKDLLEAYSAANILKRGYSIIYKDKKIISDVSDLDNNDDVDLILFKGVAKATIKETING